MTKAGIKRPTDAIDPADLKEHHLLAQQGFNLKGVDQGKEPVNLRRQGAREHWDSLRHQARHRVRERLLLSTGAPTERDCESSRRHRPITV
jgi:hypothetical protein